ncbi:MAG: hypothetical protein HY689_09755 [Chloroflexi bacterium]|nr:hypothetical protein [Chloroflexota bacterium]
MVAAAAAEAEPADPFAAAAAVLAPLVPGAVAAMGDTPFTTGQFIRHLRRSRGGEPAYQHALAVLAQGRPEGRRLAEHSLHGIVIPGLLRATPGVAWMGFARSRPPDDEGPEVPAWWRHVP